MHPSYGSTGPARRLGFRPHHRQPRRSPDLLWASLLLLAPGSSGIRRTWEAMRRALSTRCLLPLPAAAMLLLVLPPPHGSLGSHPPRYCVQASIYPVSLIHRRPVPLWAMASHHLALSSLSIHSLYKLAASITLAILLYERCLDWRQRQM